MDVLAGPTFTIDDSSGNQKDDGSVRRVMERPQFFAADDSSESSSSVGTPDASGEDEEEGEEEEAHSKLNRGIGLDSLEESLPIKKGLSGHFDGKSKSFTDLSQVSSVKELQKQENPFNKRRRLLVASRYRRTSFYTWSKPKSMPLLPLHEEEEEECRKLASPSSLSSSSSSSLTEEKKQEDQILLRRRQKTASESTRVEPGGNFKLRSFSLADLEEHDDEEEDA